MIRRTNSNDETFPYHKIKDYHYFKELLKNYDISIIRDFLKRSIKIIQILPQQTIELQPDLKYIATISTTLPFTNSNGQVTLKEGYVVNFNEEKVIAEVNLTLLGISSKTQTILKKLYYLDIPYISQLKTTEKLQFYQKCQVISLGFGSYVYRKGYVADAVYLILDGQISIFRKTKEEITKISTIGKDRLFGLYCIKHGKKNRELLAQCSQNETQVLQIPRSILQQLCKLKDTTVDKMFEGVRSQLFSLAQPSCKFQILIKAQQTENEDSTLEKRIKTFEKERHFHNDYLSDLVQTKTLLSKVKNLNLMTKQRCKQNNIKTRLSKRTYQKHKLDSCSSQNEPFLTPRTSPPRVIERSFVRLIKYPSVQQFIHRKSRV